MTNKFNTPFFGFIESLAPAMRDRAIRCLNSTSIDSVGEFVTAGDVVEEIVRRGGTFYTAEEARPIAPFTIKRDDTFCASFPYIKGERIPPNPAYAKRNWCALIVTQYCYGVYLTNLISERKISIDEITIKSYA